jgi:hypothetical protein
MPLVIQRTPETTSEYDVISGEVKLGRIMLVELSGGRTVWQWSIHAIRATAAEVKYSGYANTLDEAKQAFAANVRQLLELAGWSEIQPLDPFENAPGG